MTDELLQRARDPLGEIEQLRMRAAPPAPPALDLTSRVEARSGGRVWLTVMLDGAIVGQLCVPEAAVPALHKIAPLVSSAPKARHQEDALAGGEPPFARQDSQ